MILRVVVGVVVTATLVSVSAPAISDARANAADSSVTRQLSTLADRLQTMVSVSDPTVGPGARRVVDLRLPERTQTSAGVTTFRLFSHSGVGLATWQVGTGATTVRRLVGVPIRTVDGNLTLRESGTHRLTFALHSRGGEPILTVHRGTDGSVTTGASGGDHVA